MMKYPLFEAQDSIYNSINDALEELRYKIDIKLEIPPEGLGDFAFPCFSLAPIAKKSPNQIVLEIVKIIKKDKWIEKIEPKGAYVNFFIDKKNLNIATFKSLKEKKENYGYLDKKNKKVIVEHTSANPNGPLHVGRARNPIIGDTVFRIFKAAGYDVKTQFYLDDMGKQVAILNWGEHNKDKYINELKKYPPAGSAVFTFKKNTSDHDNVLYYQISSNLMKRNGKISSEIHEIVKKLEEGDNKTLDDVYKSYSSILEGIKESMKVLNIAFDQFIPESKFVKNKNVDAIIEKLKQSEYCGNEDGAYYLDLESFGIKGRNTKFFFLRKDGTSLYATRDIAYHLWKAKHADILINVLGEDHKLESKQVEVALNLLKADKIPNVIFYSFVSLPGGKMSTRKGRVVYLDYLIDECINRAKKEVKNRRGKELSENKIQEIAEVIGIGAIRYNIIKVQPEKDIIFKWEEALNFEGNASPFVQYAHARACSILTKNKEKISDINSEVLIHKSEVDLIKKIAMFPVIIDSACEGFKPHIITNYLFETASKFNQFYRDCPVLHEENIELRKVRLALVNALRTVLKNGLDLLGIIAPEEM